MGTLPKEMSRSDIDQNEYLCFRCEIGARERYGSRWDTERPDVVSRLKQEIELIRKKEFSAFFLNLWMLIDECRRRKIPIGPGRGSSAGSMVSYCLHITDLDPIKYGLIFSRFLTEERVDPPDIDVDFSQLRRQEVLEIARDLFGRDRTIQIGAFQRFGWKSTIEQIGPIAGMTHEQVHQLRALIPDNAMGGQKHERELAKIYEDENLPAVKEWLDRPEHAFFKEALLAADGGYQHMGRHAAGVLVMEPESQVYIPLASPDGEDVVTGWDMYDIERLGLFKQDLLGVRTLDIIQNACDQIGIRPEDIDHDHMDEKTAAVFANGDTLGIFQLEGWGYTNLTKALQPTDFISHIAALNALYRPGCLEAYVWVKDGEIVEVDDPTQIPDKKKNPGVRRMNMTELYVERRHGRMKVEYLHPDLEPILRETEGIILYQEQAMRISIEMAGFSEGKSDKLRKAIGKKRQKEMDALKDDFVNGMDANGYDWVLAHQIWDNIAAAARYSWNKSHAACYGLITYRCAWLKGNHPVAWYANLIQSYTKVEKIATAISEMKLRGIPLVAPNINESGPNFDMTSDLSAVRFGLGGIRGLGDANLQAMLRERQEGGPFSGLREFVIRCSSFPISVVKSLIAAGAFDGLSDDMEMGWSRGFLLANAETIKKNTKLKKKQHPLDGEPFSHNDLLEKEREVLGFFVTADPLGQLRQQYKAHSPERMCIGTVSNVRKKNDRKGNEMAFLTVDDPDLGRRSATVFASIWERCCDEIRKGSVVVLDGEKQVYNGREGFLVDRVLQVL